MTTGSPDAGEGVIKFRLSFRPAPPPRCSGLSQLEGWRRLFFRLGLIGRSPERYGGLAYGNVSLRTGDRRFLVSGTQTGGLPCLTEAEYAQVETWDLATNHIWAAGAIRPSSEALSHAALFQADRAIGSVIHVHCPELWLAAVQGRPEIPVTPPELAYGTAELATALQGLVEQAPVAVICMGGHQDGLLAYGATPDAAASELLRLLATAFAAAPC
ncbi:MAG: class II aldolase/adducin family protein [Methylococcaceae bacterium]|nr:class II aldolase/adducin family protein [Methylococcaceae bacterium]